MTFFGNIKVFDHDVLFHRLPYHPEIELLYDPPVRIPIFKAMIGIFLWFLALSRLISKPPGLLCQECGNCRLIAPISARQPPRVPERSPSGPDHQFISFLVACSLSLRNLR